MTYQFLCSTSFLSNKLHSPPLTKKYNNKKQQSKLEIDEILVENKTPVYDDDTSKLTFQEKMVLFNKNKNLGLTSTSSLKANRNRLTQVFYSQTHIHHTIYMTNIIQGTVCRRRM